MIDINDTELNCLRRLAKHSLAGTPCEARVIRKLLGLHLIELVPAVRLPLEIARDEYRVTKAGFAVLMKHQPEHD